MSMGVSVVWIPTSYKISSSVFPQYKMCHPLFTFQTFFFIFFCETQRRLSEKRCVHTVKVNGVKNIFVCVLLKKQTAYRLGMT